jgi:tetratricopeptide (TPR) repeat protein
MSRFVRALIACVLLATTGCASSAAQWIVSTRNHQGDVALEHLNYPDASIAYQLALKVDAKNEHARAGLVTVQLRLAQTAFAASKFEDAIDDLAIAAKYSPGDDRIDAERSDVEQAMIKRDIVVANFPAYQETGTTIRHQYEQIKVQSAAIAALIKRFGYTYDTADLTDAIRDSYELQSDLSRYTNRLIQYRQLVESGVPETKSAESVTPAASLLPLP